MSISTITLMEFRREPGEYIRAVQREGRSFLLTKAGKPAAYLVPATDAATIEAWCAEPRHKVKARVKLASRKGRNV